MLEQDRKFWARYLILCTIIFAIIFTGMTWDLNKIGFDPLTGEGLPSDMSFDYFRDSTGYHVNYGNRLVLLNTTLLPEIPENSCYQLDFNIDIIDKKISIQNNPVDPFYCGLAPALAHVT